MTKKPTYDQSPLLPHNQPESQGAHSLSDGPLTPEAAPIRKPGRLRPRVTTNFKEPSLTKQSFKDQCNINTIMANYKNTGVINHVNKSQPNYGNFLAAADFQTYQNKILEAQDAFNSIPAEIRSQFGNDPALFLDFAQDPANLEEMRELGLAPPAPPKPRTEATPPPPDPNGPEPAPPAPAASAALKAATPTHPG